MARRVYVKIGSTKEYLGDYDVQNLISSANNGKTLSVVSGALSAVNIPSLIQTELSKKLYITGEFNGTEKSYINAGSGNVTISLANGLVQKFSNTGSGRVFTIPNPPTSTATTLTLIIFAASFTLSNSNIKWANGLLPAASTSGCMITLFSAGDGIWYANVVGRVFS